MAGAVMNNGGGRRRGKRRALRPMAEINVTPFVDVMLVLLIIFMVAAPLMTAGVAVDLPKAEARAIQNDNDKPIEVSINRDGHIFIGETQVSFERLVTVLSGTTGNDPEKRIYVRGDSTLAYGQVMNVIGALNKAGFRKVALITDPTHIAP